MTPEASGEGQFCLGKGRFHTARFGVIDKEILSGGEELRRARP